MPFAGYLSASAGAAKPWLMDLYYYSLPGGENHTVTGISFMLHALKIPRSRRLRSIRWAIIASRFDQDGHAVRWFSSDMPAPSAAGRFK